MKLASTRFLALLGMAVLVLTGCPGPEPEELIPATIVSFTADPASIIEGDESTLSWETTDAVTVAITTGAGDTVELGDADAAAGSVVVTPTTTTTYTLSAQGEEGTDPATVDVTVTVEPPAAPVVTSFVADPDTIVVGGSSTLTWETANVDSIVLTDGDGAEIDLGGADPAGGSVVVSPTETTTYTLTATGRGGETTADVTVTVNPAPEVVAFTIDPTDAQLPGSTFTLSWEVAGVDTVVIVDELGTEIVNTGDLTGSVEVTPAVTTTYTLTATGPGGDATPAQVVAMIVPMISSFTVTPETIIAGDEVTFEWATEGGVEGVITGTAGFSYTIPEAELVAGTTTTTLDAGDVFTLTLTSGALVAEETVTVTLTDTPRINSLTVIPETVTASTEQPGTVNLRWNVDNAETIEVTTDTGVTVDVTGLPVDLGNIDVAITTTTVFTLTATNANGSDVATVTATVVDPPVIDVFQAIPSVAGAGETIEIIWETTNAVEITLEKGTTQLTVDPTLVDGSTTDTVAAEATYTLYARNVTGFDVSETITVTVGSPNVVSFTGTPDTVAPGETVTLDWENMGGMTLVVNDGTADVCNTAVPADVAMGSCTVNPDATTTYTLTVTNASGDATATAEVVVTDGPVIRDFSAGAALLTVGESVDLSWLVDDDAAAVAPTLALVDDQGTTYDVSAVDPNAGTFTVTPAAAGTYVFTLTATTPNTTADTATVSVEVVAAPEILTFTASNEVLDTTNGPTSSDLSWTSQGAISIELWELDDTGTPTTSVFQSTDATEIAGHTLTVSPTATTTYRLIAANAAGASASQDLTVSVDIAQIVSFTVSEVGVQGGSDTLDIVAGTNAELEWETANADTVSLSPTPVVEVTETFIDISTSGTAVELSPDSQDDGEADFAFPSGFTFPYYGTPRVGANVSTNGLMVLTQTESADYAGNSELPNSGSPDGGAMAVFWDDLHLSDTSNAPLTGSMWYDVQQVGGQDALIVMWKNVGFYTDSANPADLNFEAVLFADGSFEFRYGTMTGATDRASGSEATIGFEDDTGSAGTSLSHDTAVTGGLSNRAWRVDPSVPASGSMQVGPMADTTYVLTAENVNGGQTAEVSLRVWPDLATETLTLTATPSTPVELGTPVTLDWTVVGATEAYVVDTATGTQVGSCIAHGDPTVVGTCEFIAPAAADYQLALVANNPVSTGTSPTVTVSVYPVLSIDAFTATPQFIAAGGSADLTWAATGATTTQIQAGGSVIMDSSAGVYAPLGGTFTVTPADATEYTLIIFDDYGNNRQETVTVYVDAAQVNSFTASETQVAAGDAVTLTWDTTNGDSVWVAGSAPTETTVTGLGVGGSAVTLSNGDYGSAIVNFPAGFTFPFLGKDRTSIKVMADGYASFDLAANSTYAITPLPSQESPNGGILAPFWSDLFDDGSATVHWLHTPAAQPENSTLAIRWEGFGFYYEDCDWYGCTEVALGDLNFELVLYGDGRIEVRYGTMALTQDQTLADGGLASIGWEGDQGLVGGQLTFMEAITGGLTNRGWMWQSLAASGTTTVNPTETTTYRVCASGGGYTDCEEVTVVVVEPGDVIVTEIMANPAAVADGSGEWFELYNTTGAPIDLTGFTLSDDGADSHVIDPANGTVVIPAGGFLVFGNNADTATNGGVAVDYAYANWFLSNSEDEIVLSSGTTEIDRVNYASGWPVGSGASIQLAASLIGGDPTVNDDPASWCPASAPYGDGDLGNPGSYNETCGFIRVTGSPELDIPDSDSTGVADILTVTDACTISDISVDVNISHTFIGDLDIDLISPTGTTVRLHDGTGSSADDIVGNYPATLTPAQALTALAGEAASGDWTLFLADHAGGDTGTLHTWGINLVCQ